MTSFMGTLTPTAVFELAMDIQPYFGSVILWCVGITAAIWGITWMINTLIRVLNSRKG